MIALATLRTAPRRWVSTNRRQPAVRSATCVLFTAGHDALDPRPYVLGAQRPYIGVTACRGCLGVMELLTTVAPDPRA